MPQVFLDLPKIHALHEQVRRKTMSQRMHRNRLDDTGYAPPLFLESREAKPFTRPDPATTYASLISCILLG